ncbi:MAG: ABC transporter permease [Clostridiales bacterium]|nr:ABC transporter permease [Clostridiales bacterium]
MSFRSWGFYIRNGFQNILRNRVMALASITAIMVALFVLGLILVIAFNLDVMVENMESKMEITIYLKDETTEEQRLTIENNIRSWEGVYEIVFVSKQEALDKWRTELGDKGKLLEGYSGENNPLPDSFLIKIQKPEYVEDIVERVRAIPAVDDINYSSRVAEFIGWFARGIRIFGALIVAILAVVAVIVISNTVRLTVYSRRKEINIMKYIGATDWFIRWPFIIEGMVLGMIGALLSTCLVVGVYKLMIDRSGYIDVKWGYLGIFKLLPMDKIMFPVLVISMMVGVCVGIMASCISIRKHLKV